MVPAPALGQPEGFTLPGAGSFFPAGRRTHMDTVCNAIHKAVDAASKVTDERPRTYIGASLIGHTCDRYIWLEYHKGIRDKLDARTFRIFELGNKIEDIVVDLLIRAGMEVFSQQVRFSFSACRGKLVGHIDGIVTDLPGDPETHYLLEIKSANAKRWRDMNRRGVEATSTRYWEQCQVSMLRKGLQKTLFVAYNKDTSELYFERLTLDKSYARGIVRRAKTLIEMEDMPGRLSDDPEWFECRWCGKRAYCYPEADA
jgi:hypothetical protein